MARRVSAERCTGAVPGTEHAACTCYAPSSLAPMHHMHFTVHIFRRKWRTCHLKRYVTLCVWVLSHFSCVQLFATPWTIAHQAPLSLRFPRQKYWSRLPFPSPGDLLDWGIKPVSPVAPALQAETHGRHPLMWNNTCWKSCMLCCFSVCVSPINPM